MQFHFAAVCAFESRRKVAFERQAAAFAKRRSDEADLLPAFRANETAFGYGAFGFAKPADLGIEKSEAGVEPVLDWRGKSIHHAIWNGLRFSPSGRNLKMKSVSARTKNASQPS